MEAVKGQDSLADGSMKENDPAARNEDDCSPSEEVERNCHKHPRSCESETPMGGCRDWEVLVNYNSTYNIVYFNIALTSLKQVCHSLFRMRLNQYPV